MEFIFLHPGDILLCDVIFGDHIVTTGADGAGAGVKRLVTLGHYPH